MPLLADAGAQVLQIDWQSISVLGSILGGAILGGAKILAAQWDKNATADAKRHNESRDDAREARDENRALSKIIIGTQAETVKVQVEIAKALAGLQREIEHVVTRLDRLEGGRPADAARKP